MQKPQLSHYLLFAYRIAILYVLLTVTRVVFYAFNADLFSDISFGDFMTILRGGLKFDTTAIIYLNIVFIAMNILPFRFVYNAVYQKMQDLLSNDGFANYYVGTVEAEPSLEDVIAKVKEGNYKKVVLEPLMVVAGDHANNDMAGDDEDSWKSAFLDEGFEVECLLRGLGENEDIQKIYVEHAQKAIDSIK